MPARRHIFAISIAALVMLFSVSTCGGDPDTFQGTVVAPLTTLSALTPGPELYATLTAKAGDTRPLAAARPDTPTPRPATPIPRPATPVPRLDTATPRPVTATPRPITPTALPSPTPQEAAPTVAGDAYLQTPQQVGVLGETWTLSDIRVGLHSQKVRVVWEVAEDRTTAPLTEIVEVDNTTSPFPWRGALIDSSWGAARIDVMISDTYAYDIPLADLLPITMPGDSTVTKVGVHPTFDDALLGFSIGLSEPAPYEVFTLTNPTRIVVDVILTP